MEELQRKPELSLETGLSKLEGNRASYRLCCSTVRPCASPILLSGELRWSQSVARIEAVGVDVGP